MYRNLHKTFHMNPARRFHFLFWPVATLTIAVMLLELNHQTVLRNDTAPYGIVSLGLGRGYARDTGIVQSWKDSLTDTAPQDFCAINPKTIFPLNTAKTDVALDYLFIVLYTASLAILLTFLETQNNKLRNTLITLAVIAAACDCLENIGLRRFLDSAGTQTIAIQTAIFAITKIVISSALLLYIAFLLFFRRDALKWLSAYARRKMAQLFRYRVILLGVIFFAIPIWFLDQGQDLLVNSNSGDLSVALFVGVVLIAATLNWWLAKLFFHPGYAKGQPILPLTSTPQPVKDDPHADKKVARFLGVCTILLPAAAILHALQAIRIPYWLDQFDPYTWLIGLLLTFFILIRCDLVNVGYTYALNRLNEPVAKKLAIGLFALLGFVIPLIIRLTALKDQHRSPGTLNYLFLQLLLLALAFYVFSSLRERLFPNKPWLTAKIGIPIVFIATLLAACFLLYNIFPFATRSWNGCYLSLPILLSGIIFYILILTLLLRAGLAKGVNFLLFIGVIGLALAIKGNNHYHDVQRITVKTAPQRITLDVYFRQWLLHRQTEIENTKGQYPIFLINSYGGGIRAAAYTNLVLSYLDDTLNRRGNPAFEHYVFSISGASGGTVGAAIQCAYRAIHPDSIAGAYSHFQDDFENFYQHDFLTPVLSNALGSDLWASPIGIRLPFWRDRSAIQEDLWAKYARDSMKLSLDSEFNSLWDTGRTHYEVPLLFSNTLNVDDGNRAICAPVDLDHGDFPAAIFIRERLDFLNAHHSITEDSLKSISLITGAFLSARFPYISPSGKMGPGYHFMDVGGKDNSGASTSEDIFRTLSHWAMAKSQTDTLIRRLMRKVSFYFVSISNTPRASLDQQPDPRQLVSNRWEPISPIVGFINSGTLGNAAAADSALRFRYEGAPLPGDSMRAGYCAIWPTATCIADKDNDRYCPLLPLGWQISEPSLTRLRTCFSPGNIRCNPVGICRIMAILRLE